MRVLHVISSIDPRAGGTTSALAALAIAQQQAGLSVSVAAPRTADFRNDAVVTMNAAAVNVFLLESGSSRRVSGKRLAKQLTPLIANVDIVHIHACWEEIQHQAAAVARQLNKPYLFTPHGMLDPWSLRQSRIKKQIYLALRLRRDLNEAAAIHYADEVERDLVEPLQLKPSAIVEPHIVDLSDFNALPDSGCFRAKYPLMDGRPLVLFMSRVHPKKGLDLLIPAFARVQSNAILAIAGPADPVYENELRELAQAHGIADRIIFTGMLYGRDRVAALVDADVFVLPSYQENFGIVIIESLAAGTPVIISDQVNIHRLISSAGVGRVIPTTIDALEQALSDMLGSETMRKQAAERARPFIRQNFDASKTAARWVEHYAALLAARGSVPA